MKNPLHSYDVELGVRSSLFVHDSIENFGTNGEYIIVANGKGCGTIAEDTVDTGTKVGTL